MLNLSAPAKLHLMIINYMSTTHCETNIVRIRVGLLNDILRSPPPQISPLCV